MISFAEAHSIVLAHAHPLDTTSLPLEQLPSAYLAEPVIATADMPLFDNSAVDGYGVRLADVEGTSAESPACLRVCATIRAGDAACEAFASGLAVKVLTGAPVPAWVEAVVMREDCAESPGKVAVKRQPRAGENIRRRGEEFSQGEEVLPAGMRITPAVIGVLATCGYAQFPVYRKPRVALIVTGNELVDPGQPLGPGQIYDSNSYMLVDALREMGIHEPLHSRAADDPALLREQLSNALANADVVITVGGVSVGDYDFVKEVCEELGVVTQCWKVAIKPGKPFYFGTRANANGEKLVCGLPGNPVSALVTFHELVKPALLRMMGAAEVCPPMLIATLTKSLRKKAGRMEFVRGFASARDGQLVVEPTVGQDSHMLGGMAKANCLIHFPQEANALAVGDTVDIELLGWR
ncbi:MAG: molybdopterin molybdotransferase MoeA [Armatimonadota bacterium]